MNEQVPEIHALLSSALTLIAVGKACIQKFFGFNAAETHWLFVPRRRSTHIIQSGVRYFRSSATPLTSAARWDFRWSSFRSRRSTTAIRG